MFEEEHLHQSAALWREPAQGFAEHLFFLSLLQKILGDRRSLRYRQIKPRIAAHQALLLLFPAMTVMVGYQRQPFGKRPWLAKFG